MRCACGSKMKRAKVRFGGIYTETYACYICEKKAFSEEMVLPEAIAMNSRRLKSGVQQEPNKDRKYLKMSRSAYVFNI